MSFVPKTWHNKGDTVKTPLSASAMNDLENRIDNAFNELEVQKENIIEINSSIIKSTIQLLATKAGNMIEINLLGEFTDEVKNKDDNTAYTLFTIKEKYRPKNVTYLNGELTVGSDIWAVKQLQYAYANPTGEFRFYKSIIGGAFQVHYVYMCE